jgi:hypothetical protein
MKNHILCLLLVTLLSGCAVKIVPDQSAAGVINQKENSITLAKESIVMTVSPADTDMINYNLEGMVASFNVDIQNTGESEVVFDNESFILLDADKRQYYQLTAEKIRQMLAKDTYYLLPYPYVGFYYLEDYEQASFKNSTNSNLPYYFEMRPQDIFTKSLPIEPLIPKASTKGLVYFHADVTTMKAFSILAFKKGASKKGAPDFIFPFRVEK